MITQTQTSARCHSVGLPVLCAVQFLERLAGYMIAASLALFLDENLRLGEGRAARFAGYFLAASYAAAVPGGVAVDRVLGAARGVRVAALLLAVGYALACIGSAWALLLGASLLVIGSGLFRPSVAALTGTLRAGGSGEPFRWLYFVVNIAALTAPLLSGVLRAYCGWESIPATAAAVLIASCVLLHRHCGHAHPLAQRAAPNPTSSASAHKSESSPHRISLTAFFVVFLLLGVAMNQSLGTLLFWARDDTSRSMFGLTLPPETFAMLPGGLVLLYTPLLAALSSAMTKRRCAFSSHAQVSVGLLCAVAAYALMVPASLLRAAGGAPVSSAWLTACLACITLAEALVLPLGMRLVSDLAPPQRVTQTHGLFCLASALSYLLAGEVGGLWTRWPHVYFFALLGMVCVVALAIHAGARRQSGETA